MNHTQTTSPAKEGGQQPDCQAVFKMLGLSDMLSMSHRLIPDANWKSLRPAILSAEGKRIVDADPNLSDETMELLRESESGVERKDGNKMLSCDPSQYSFNFGLNPGDNTTGLTTLSSCIKDKPDATMANLVTRYADLRNIPFYVVAIEIKRLQRERGLFCYASHDSRGFAKIAWKPCLCNTTATSTTIKKRGERSGKRPAIA